MKLNQDKINTALKALDWPAVERELDAVSLTEDDVEAALKLVLRSDRMVKRRPGDDGAARDLLLQRLQEYLRSHSFGEGADKVPELQGIFRKIDKGYLAIYASEAALEFTQLTPQQRIDSIFGALADVATSMKADFDRTLKQGKYISAGMKFEDATGTGYHPPAIFHGLTLAATDALLLEAYSNGYLQGGVMVLPVPGPSTATAIAAANVKLVNAGLWRRWKYVDEHHRYLGAKLEEFNPPELPDWVTQLPPALSLTTVLEFLPDRDLTLMDHVATERFDQRMIQTLQEMLRGTNLLKIIAPKGAPQVPLPPKGTISMQEAHAGTLLGEYLSMPLDTTLAGSMFLHERLRGYAVLQQLAIDLFEKNKTYFPRISKADLEAELTRCGMSSKAVAAFIKEATFGKSNRDFYDQPLIQLQDGHYLLFGFALVEANLVKVMLSSLQNAKLPFQGKGPAYEDEVLRVLQGEGFTPRKLKVYRGPKKEHEFDYDVTFVWDDYVFFLECKNRSIPFGQPIAMAYFKLELESHAAQVARLRNALTNYPDIIDADYPQAKGKKPVFCVVNSLPFSLGSWRDIYYIDHSLLGRFFKPSGTFGVEIGKLAPGSPIVRDEVARLWAGNKPTAKDFIRYISSPPQLHLGAAHYELKADWYQLSLDTVLKTIEFSRVTLDEAQVAKILVEATNRNQKNGAGTD